MNKKYVVAYETSGDETHLLTKIQSEMISAVIRPSILVDFSIKKQIIDGFGAALTESSAYLIAQLENKTKASLIEELFTKKGIDISLVRTTIGASDFSLRSYTYSDTIHNEPDLNLDKFDLGDDFNFVIPVLKTIQENKHVLILSSPWSAPAWMKDNLDLNGGHLLEKYYQQYASYLVKFIEAYQKEGLSIYAITLQNEPKHESKTYPSMLMSSNDQKKLIIEVGKAFKNNHIDTKIIAYDHNWDDIQYAKNIYEDKEASSYIAGTAFHCYDGNVRDTHELVTKYPDKGLWFTECSGGLWANNFSDNLHWNTKNVFIGSLTNGAKSVLLWNIALDTKQGPTNGGCMNCRGLLTIDPASSSIIRNVEYYLVAHFSKFVQTGAVVISTTVQEHELLAVGFINPDLSEVIVVYNERETDRIVTISHENDIVQLLIKAKSLVTLKVE